MKGLCGACGHVHDSSWARAVGRFNQSVPTLYRASHPEAMNRPTRTEAEADMCEHLKESR